MDLWDVAKLMGRRWYVALPMLVLTMVAALWTVAAVKPDYTATTNVTLLPPLVRNDTPVATGHTVNPWDTQSLTMATMTYLNSKRLHDQMEAEGFSPIWTADTDLRFPNLIIIEVTAPGPDLAQTTAKELQDRVTEEVARQQARYSLKPGEEITIIPFDDGDNLDTATSKVKRALIVVVGVGIILTIALTVSLDAFLRWRAERRRPRNAVPDEPDMPTAGGPAKTAKPINVHTATTSTFDVADGNVTQETRALPRIVRYQPAATTNTTGGVRDGKWVAAPAHPSQVHEEDATIVLPRSNGPWAGKSLKRVKPGDKTTENGKR